MLNLHERTKKRLTKRAEKTIKSWEKKNGNEARMSDIRVLPALAISDRIAFVIVGGVLLWVSYLFVKNQSWTFPMIFVPIAGYVTIRGITGHALKIKEKNEDVIATSVGIVTAVDSNLSRTGRTILIIDICFAILLIVVEIDVP